MTPMLGRRAARRPPTWVALAHDLQVDDLARQDDGLEGLGQGYCSRWSVSVKSNAPGEGKELVGAAGAVSAMTNIAEGFDCDSIHFCRLSHVMNLI
jgi:hypothetical protein